MKQRAGRVRAGLLGAGLFFLGFGAQSLRSFVARRRKPPVTVRELRLYRPLVTLDLETTGLKVDDDRIIEIGCIKLLPRGATQYYHKRLHPGNIVMHPEAEAIHGITMQDLADCPSFADIAQELHKFLHGCDIHGYNAAKFDVQMLMAEFQRAGIDWPDEEVVVVDSYQIFVRREPRTLTAAAKVYLGVEHSAAHSAMGDAEVTLAVLKAQLQHYPDLPITVPELVTAGNLVPKPGWVDPEGRFVWRGQEVVFNFGRAKGLNLRDVAFDDREYLQWMLRSSFSLDVRRIVKAALRGEFPVRPAGGEADAPVDNGRNGAGVEANGVVDGVDGEAKGGAAAATGLQHGL